MFISYEDFLRNLERVRAQITAACQKFDRDPASVKLLPVTKNHPINAAYYAGQAGIKAVGENRVQEALGKIDESKVELDWELIGPLQSNKAKRAATAFARVQSIDRPKILKALERHCVDEGRSLRVLLQVNAGADPNKAGVSLDQSDALLEEALSCQNLKVEGFMTIAPLTDDKTAAKRCFAAMRECRDRLAAKFLVQLPELSMGMSGDLEDAIAEGSTMVRVGTALYGKRQY